ncbi:MAG: alanine--tRNA ligase, partial [Bacilli bacterium]|nr:alanine--tRNA ligase [Bacilli bacterium]
MKTMTSNEIREMYIKYFEGQGHQKFPSASLIPDNDPTLLWINAGVTPLKKYFDGSEIPKNRRIVSSQKCIRTNDIENVGKTARHHTFFEMLGNFSVGDYFKKEAVAFSYELLTSEKYFGMDKDKLYITVYPTDEETYNLWLEIGVDSDHIIKLESNYWEIGEGPCGPDTEIFYDRGKKYDPDNLGIKLLTDEIENDRYIEIWNNVLSQYNAKSGFSRKEYPELPSKNIDTGMGLERMACVLQGTETNYETDLFMPIIEEVKKISEQEYHGEMSFKVIADHIRALTFAISDGAVFSNEGRGYVLRRLLRRAVRYGKKLNIEKPFMYQLVEAVVKIMGKTYPELKDNQSNIEKLILKEEKLFHKTLSSGEKRLLELTNSNIKEISGEDVFKLYDTYGFPFELTQEILAEKGFTVSINEFNECMQKQKEKARQARKKEASMKTQNKAFLDFKTDSTFIGYDDYECITEVIGLIKNEELVSELYGSGYVILEKTPFYAQSGGQAPDKGTIEGKNFDAEVVDVIKGPNKQHIHFVKVQKGKIKMGTKVNAKIDVERRESIMKNHSAAHLLLEALNETLEGEILQAGASVGSKSFRFDFTCTGKVTDEDLVLAEKLVNEKIQTKVDAVIEYMPLTEAVKKGAIALFVDKYDDVVRTVKLYDSFDLCGGTHVKNVGDINRFAIKLIDSKGTNVYRIEAVTDKNIEDQLFAEIKPYNDEMKKLLSKAKNIVETAYIEDINLDFDVKIDNSKPTSYQDVIFNRNEVEMIREQVKELEKNYYQRKQETALSDLDHFDQFIEENAIGEYIVTKVENYDLSILKQLIDKLVDKLDKGFVFIANVTNNNVNFIAKCHKEISAQVNCGDYIKAASVKAKGNGGGSKVFGQGGGNDISSLDEILTK